MFQSLGCDSGRSDSRYHLGAVKVFCFNRSVAIRVALTAVASPQVGRDLQFQSLGCDSGRSDSAQMCAL